MKTLPTSTKKSALKRTIPKKQLKETSLGTEVKHDQNSLGGEATSEQALESDSRKKFIRGGL